MTMQPDLLDGVPQRYRNSDPHTSAEAAVRISPRIGELQALVLRWFETQPDGATDEELLAAFKSTSSTYRTRRSELVDMGKIRDSGRTKVLSTKRRAIVWEVVKKV